MSFQATESGLSGLPLAAVPVVAIDCETTGLDVKADRIVEIAAVRLDEKGAAGPDNAERQSRDRDVPDRDGPDRNAPDRDVYVSLVSPGIPIPPASTAIHGITDDEVAAAPPFPQVMAGLAAWAGPSVVVGYAIGFDLAVLANEHHRHGLDWAPPRSLCVRHLMQLVAPELPNQSLELAAKWLRVEPGERHRARGDAETAARIFHALLPRLREKGIVTLAQAERVCRGLTSRLEEEAQAGWHDVLRDRRIANEGVAEYARIDSFPYRHRVFEIMRAPALCVPAEMTLKQALAVMMEKGISSVFLDPSAEGAAYGILTERDILRAFDADGAEAFARPVAHYGKVPLITVEQDEFVYRAITGMSQRGFRHLGVRDDAEKLVGALSARDLLRQRASDAVSLGDALERAEKPGDLGRIWAGLTTVARGLVFEEADPRDIAAIVSRELRALTRRACELAEAMMKEEGKGAAPRPYAMMVLGSGGRGESLLAMDQDNAVVFDQGEPGGPEDAWFERFGALVADMLNGAGVIYCPGGIMASKPEWRMDLRGWRRRIEIWIGNARPEDLLNCDIFFDAVPVYGERVLAEGLIAEALAAARGSRNFLKGMSVKAGDFQSQLNWLGRPRLESGRIDLKKGGLMPVFSAARVAALTHGIARRSTPERLEALRELDVVDAALIGRLIEAHRILLGAILGQQLRDLHAGVALSNKVAPGELSAYDRQQLNWALRQIDGVRDLLGIPALG